MLWDDLEPDGSIPGASVAPGYMVPYGEYRGFLGESASPLACLWTLGRWFGQDLR